MKAFMLFFTSVTVFYVTRCAVSLAEDPFAEQIKAQTQTPGSKAAELKEKNALTVPADLLAKMAEYDWVDRSAKAAAGKATRGKVFKVYYKVKPSADPKQNSNDECPAVSSFVVRDLAGKETELSEAYRELPDGTADTKYLGLVAKKLWQDKSAETASIESSDKDKKLADKRAEHTAWRVKTPHIDSHREPNILYSEQHVGPPGSGVVYRQPYPDPNHSHTVSRKTFKFDQIQGALVSYTGNEVVIHQGNANVTYNYNNFGASDQRFLNEYRKLEKE